MTYHILSRYRTELMGIAMLRVMLSHSYGMELGNATLNYLRALGGGVDIFFVISAIGLVGSLLKRPHDDAEFLRRRAKRILPSFYLVMIPYTLFLILRRGVPWSALIFNGSLLYYWTQTEGSFNWYVSVMMLYYAATPFCFRMLYRSKHRVLLTAATFLISILICQLLTHERFVQYSDAYARIPVYAIGLLLGFFVAQEKKLTWKDILFWIAYFIAGVFYYRIHTHYDTRSWPFFFTGYHVNLLIMPPLMLFACIIFEKLPLGWLRWVLRIIGESSLEIYLLNVSLFGTPLELRSILPNFGGDTLRLYYFLLWIVNLLLGIGLHWVVEAVRRKFTDTHKKVVAV